MTAGTLWVWDWGGWANLVQGAVGAVIGGVFTVVAAWWVFARERKALERSRLVDAVLEALHEVSALEDEAARGMPNGPTRLTYGNTIAVTKAVALAVRIGDLELHDSLMGGRARAARGLDKAMAARAEQGSEKEGWAQARRALMGLRAQLQQWLTEGRVGMLPPGAFEPGD